jgi:probable F420-dependent oxidoreductase
MDDQQPVKHRPVEVGIHLLAGSIPHAGVITRWADLVAVARRAEDAGFDAITVGDHLQMDFSTEGFAFGTPECFSLLSALAASTDRIELAPLVVSTAYRNPALLAKTAATIDEISGSRFALGLGAGWHEYEFRAFGFPFDHRVDRFEEALQIILPLLRGECVTFHGRYHQVEDCELLPEPRPGGPPIMIGAKGPRMMRLAARHADIWDADLAPSATDPAQMRPAIEAIHAACHEVGRDPATLKKTTWIHASLPGHSKPDDHPLAAMRASWGPATGTPEELAELLRGFAAEGFDRVGLWIDPSTPEGVEELAKTLGILDHS